MTLPKLSEGALSIIMKGGTFENPIMQILGSKKIASGSSDKERYRLLLSDGKYLISFAMLSTHINELIVAGELKCNSIIKIKKHITSVINNSGRGDKRVLVILDLELLVPGDTCSKIGSPVQLPDDEISCSSSEQNSTTSNGTKAHPQEERSTVSHNQSSNLNSSLNTSLQDSVIHPISSLSPYQNKWVIKARIVNKSPIRTWSNARGEGKLFSIDLLDESGEIKATGFREIVDKFYDFLEVDKVYFISKCQLKIANKQFSTLNNDYEMTFTNDTIIQECVDDTKSIPQVQYNFIPINQIANIEMGSLIDVIGVCKTSSDVTSITARTTGREHKKRNVQLTDQSDTSIEITLWGRDAENFDGSSQPILALKGARVGEFNGGKNISVLSSTHLKINPDIPEAHRLRGWFDNGGSNNTVTNLSVRSGAGGAISAPWMNFEEVKLNKLGNAEKGDYFQVKATVLLIKTENALYKACPTEECNKKVIDLQNGMYRCEKCNAEFTNFKYRYILMLNICDWSGNQWVNMFNSEAEKMLGVTAQEAGEALENDPEAFAAIADRVHFKEFVFKCRTKSEVYNDENRLKTTALAVNPIDYKEYNAYLLSKIDNNLNC